MPALIEVSVETQRLIDALQRVPERLQAPIDAVVQSAAENIAREAKARVARRTGATAKAITAVKARRGRGWVVLTALEPDIPTNLDLWIEVGTSTGMPARPYLHPAAALERAPFEARIREVIRREVSHGR